MISRRSILAHRGLWSEPNEQNSLGALVNAVRMGFGVETDVRDSNSEIVISHDPTVGGTKLRDFFEFLQGPEIGPVVALNVKADGLLSLFEPTVASTLPDGSFFFDMSAPETLRYRKANFPTAVRISDYEKMSDLEKFGSNNSRAIWLDSFDSDWWLDVTAGDLVPDEWTAYVVSPELHGREPSVAWQRLQERDWEDRAFGICTDYPMEFLEFMGSSVE